MTFNENYYNKYQLAPTGEFWYKYSSKVWDGGKDTLEDMKQATVGGGVVFTNDIMEIIEIIERPWNDGETYRIFITNYSFERDPETDTITDSTILGNERNILRQKP